MGNRTKYTDWSGTMTYQYNNANMLTSYGVILNTGTVTGNYDITSSTNNITVGISVIASSKTAVCEYDSYGNMTARVENGNRTEYVYDYENRLTKIVFPNGSYQQYKYDHAGKRVMLEKYKTSTSTSPVDTQMFVYDKALGNSVYEITGSTVTRNVYAWPSNKLVCAVAVNSSTTTIKYFHTDGLGSVSALTDSNGAVTNSYKYDPFGNILSMTGNNNASRFVGSLGAMDDDTGLVLMGARYYDPVLGRFISKDKLQRTNRYMYCSNNPVNFVDPSGLEEESAFSMSDLDNPDYREWVSVQYASGNELVVMTQWQMMQEYQQYYSPSDLGTVDYLPYVPITTQEYYEYNGNRYYYGITGPANEEGLAAWIEDQKKKEAEYAANPEYYASANTSVTDAVEYSVVYKNDEEILDYRLFDKLKQFAKIYKLHITITSGYRLTGSHTEGISADIRADGKTMKNLSDMAYKSGLFNRIGVYEEGKDYSGDVTGPHVHLDMKDEKNYWRYEPEKYPTDLYNYKSNYNDLWTKDK